MSLYPTVFRLPSLDYPPSRKGFWGPVTSTINWCEEVRSMNQRLNSAAADEQLLGLLRYNILCGDCEFVDEPGVCISGVQRDLELHS